MTRDEFNLELEKMEPAGIENILIEIGMREIEAKSSDKDVLVREINEAFTNEQLATLLPEDLDMSI